MEVEESPKNSLLSNSKSSDSRLQVQLHPLVILTISDYITRHLLRKQPGPIVGAILGSQNGRDITMEHAFECKVESGESDSDVLIDAGWFHDRLQQYKDVHKAPALDFVGWFTLASPIGPDPAYLPIHQQLLQSYNESALLLTFNPSSIGAGETKSGKLPLAIYETVYEATSADDDKRMLSSGEAGPQLSLRFQELPYSIESGDAEMIGVDFVARTSGNARAVNGSLSNEGTTAADEPSFKDKGKAPAATTQDAQLQQNMLVDSGPVVLSSEEEEAIGSMIAKSNAIKMLQERIRLVKSYLSSLPPSYLNESHANPSNPVEISPNARISYPILRQINSMLARLPLLTPVSTSGSTEALTNSAMPSFVDQAPDSSDFVSPHTLDRQTQQTDAQLVTLLTRLGGTLQSASSLGNKFQIYEAAHHMSLHSQRRGMGQMPLAFDQTGFSDGIYSANPSFGSIGASKFGKSNGSMQGGPSGPSLPLSSHASGPTQHGGDDGAGDFPGESSMYGHHDNGMGDETAQQEYWEEYP